MAATFAGTPSLRLRLKSILRYRRLAPPPRWRDVLRPLALRPPLFVRPSTRDFSGVVFVISAKSAYETKRRPGDVGLGLRIGIRDQPPGPGRSGSNRLRAPARSPSSRHGCGPRCSRAAWAWREP